jgi:hypothetical protein
MERKAVLFAFNGEPMCFVHVLLNAQDMADRGWEAAVVIEGSATKLVAELDDPDRPYGPLYQRVRERGLIAGVCKACAAKTGSLAAVEEQGLPLLADMAGHPSVAAWRELGYEVITF